MINMIRNEYQSSCVYLLHKPDIPHSLRKPIYELIAWNVCKDFYRWVPK